jgi:ribonuclease HI
MDELYIKGKYGKLAGCTNDGTSIFLSEFVNASDNQCEWMALIQAMKYISGEWNSTLVHTDSLILFRQLMGDYRIKAPTLKPLYYEWNVYKNILSGLVKYHYVSGCDNKARGLIGL